MRKLRSRVRWAWPNADSSSRRVPYSDFFKWRSRSEQESAVNRLLFVKFLWCLFGKEPTATQERSIDLALVLARELHHRQACRDDLPHDALDRSVIAHGIRRDDRGVTEVDDPELADRVEPGGSSVVTYGRRADDLSSPQATTCPSGCGPAGSPTRPPAART